MSDSTDADVPEILFLTDINGRAYKLLFYEYDTAWKLWLYDRKIHVAKVDCVVLNGFLFIGNLQVFDEAKVWQSAFSRWLAAKCGLEAKTRNYQHLNLGTQLLNLVIQRAKERKLIGITGNLFPRDLQVNPDLPRWYRSKGFQVTLEKGNSSGTIELKLP
jgi:GNAT superfamily N-acetyltransferase